MLRDRGNSIRFFQNSFPLRPLSLRPCRQEGGDDLGDNRGFFPVYAEFLAQRAQLVEQRNRDADIELCLFASLFHTLVLAFVS